MAPEPPRFACSNFKAAILGTNSFDQEELKVRVSFAQITPRIYSGNTLLLWGNVGL